MPELTTQTLNWKAVNKMTMEAIGNVANCQIDEFPIVRGS